MAVETMTAGNNTAGRESSAPISIVCAAAAFARHANPLGIDVGQFAEPIEHAERVVCLQAHDRLKLHLGLRAIKTPAGRRFHFRALLLVMMGHILADLLAVGIADHVPDEGHAAHASERDAAGLMRITSADVEPLRPLDELLPDLLHRRFVKPAVRKMAVR